MRRRGLWAACVALLMGVGVLAVGAGYAKDENGGVKCSEATLHGIYLVAQNGVVIEGKNQGPFAAAGYEVFDGNGEVKAVVSANFNGVVISKERSSGTYTVEENCTGTTTYPDLGVQNDLFIAPDGSKLTFVQTDPTRFVTAGFEPRGTAERVDENAEDENAEVRCSEATLHGMYLLAYDGVDIMGNDQVPFAVAGHAVFDGNGEVDQVFSGNFNGEVFSNQRLTDGMYTVKANCTGTSTFISDGETFLADLFIAPDGSMYTFVQIKPPEQVASGFTLRGTAQRVGD
jgi:hypothetical protein